METLINQVENVGFPIVVSMYLLIKLEGKMEKLNDNISKLTNVIEKNMY